MTIKTISKQTKTYQNRQTCENRSTILNRPTNNKHLAELISTSVW